MSAISSGDNAAIAAQLTALLAQIINRTMQTAVGTFTSGVSGAFSAYQVIVASTSKEVREINVSGTIYNAVAVGPNNVDVAVGGAGSEVVQGSARVETETAELKSEFFIRIPNVYPAGSRITIRASSAIVGGDTVMWGAQIAESA